MGTRQYDAIIVGGGHNGLVCAAYLAKAGQRVAVLERRSRVGGAAVTEEVWPGYHVSVLSYVVSLLRPDIVRDLDLHRFGYEVFPLDPAHFVPFPDGRSLFLWMEARHTAEEIAKFSKRDAAAYLDYDQVMSDLVAIVRPLLDAIPPSVQFRSVDDMWRALGLGRHLFRHRRNVARLVDMLTMSVADFLDEWFEDPAVKGAMSSGGVIGAWAGPRSPGTAYVLLHHRMGEVVGQRGGWGFVRGGMGQLSEAIAAAARVYGADIRTEAAVAGILVEADRATGVALADGTEFRAPRVVSGIHPKTTFLDLVGRQHLPGDLVADIERYRSRSGSAKVNLALAELPNFTAVPSAELGPQHPETFINPSISYLDAAWHDAEAGRWSRDPMIGCVIPTTKDLTLAPAGKHIMSCFVQYAPGELDGTTWDQEREALGDRVVEVLGTYAPNLPQSVIHRQVVSPLDMEREFGLLGGNIFQGEMSLDQLFSFRPSPQAGAYRTPLAGLYLCGSGTHPGGGVMGAPGRNAARVILTDVRRGRRRQLVCRLPGASKKT